jgi:hypothetical protein
MDGGRSSACSIQLLNGGNCCPQVGQDDDECEDDNISEDNKPSFAALPVASSKGPVEEDAAAAAEPQLFE